MQHANQSLAVLDCTSLLNKYHFVCFALCGPKISILVLFSKYFVCMGAGWKNILSRSTNEYIHLMYCLFVLPGLPVCCECLCPFVLINLPLQIKTSICWRSYLYLSSSSRDMGYIIPLRFSSGHVSHENAAKSIPYNGRNISPAVQITSNARKKVVQWIMGKKKKKMLDTR